MAAKRSQNRRFLVSHGANWLRKISASSSGRAAYVVTIWSQMSRLLRITPVASSGLEQRRLGMSPWTHAVSSGISGTSIDSASARSAVIVANPPVPVRTPRPRSADHFSCGQLLEELQPVDELVDLEARCRCRAWRNATS